jgi:hypothetical protein
MSSKEDDRSAQEIGREMDDEAGRMETRLEQLDDHVDDAKKKAAEARPQEGLAGDDALDAVSGDADERTTSSDDPTSAVGDPEDDDGDPEDDHGNAEDDDE